VDQESEDVLVLYIFGFGDAWEFFEEEDLGVSSCGGGNPVVVPSLVFFLKFGLEESSERSQYLLYKHISFDSSWILR